MRIENESVRRIKPFELSSIQTIYLILQAVSSSRITTRRRNKNQYKHNRKSNKGTNYQSIINQKEKNIIHQKQITLQRPKGSTT